MRWLGVALVVGSLALAAAAHALEIGPGSDWCRALRELAPGEELVLRPGEYVGRCSVRRGGTAARPLVIRAQDPATPPRLTYPERDGNLIDVHASHVVLRHLHLGPTRPSVDAVRIHLASDVRIEYCQFTGIGGIAVVANSGSVREITVRGNVIRQSGATALYFGCHDGSCAVSQVLVEDNRIERVDAAPGEVGYGVQVKLNSAAVIRRNTVVDPKGPGIMVYGDRDLLRVTLVERNVVVGSRRSSGIVVGGGPAVVRNNLVVRNAEAGIALQDYGGRGLLRSVVVAHNTVFDNGRGGVVAPAAGALDAVIVNNAVHARAGTPPLPAPRAGFVLSGNIDCSLAPCFTDPLLVDLTPAPLSTLVAMGSPRTGPWLPDEDYFGRRRSSLPTVGAIEAGAPPFPLLLRVSDAEGSR